MRQSEIRRYGCKSMQRSPAGVKVTLIEFDNLRFIIDQRKPLSIRDYSDEKGITFLYSLFGACLQ